VAHYNAERPHRSLALAAPAGKAPEARGSPPAELCRRDVLGGVIPEYYAAAAVLLCKRRGAAVDLVLDRARLARSQFVFTQVKGREAIFWQTQKTARAANPGGRIPRRRRLREAVTITVDTRERYP
jgi:hypothetical protein